MFYGYAQSYNASAYTIVMTPRGELVRGGVSSARPKDSSPYPQPPPFQMDVFVHNATLTFDMVRPHPLKEKTM